MVELLTTWSVTEILIMVVMLLLALKEVISLVEYYYKKIKGYFNRENQNKLKAEEILDKLEKMNNELIDLSSKIENLSERLDTQDAALSLLTESDRDDIKGYIVEKYNKFYREDKCIDEFSMDALEKRFKHYQDEGGNSYVLNLMEQLRTLEIK